MSRDLTTQLAADIDTAEIEPFFAIDLEFDSGTIRLWSGYGSRTIAGETYIGTGDLMSVSNIEETAEMAVKGVTMVLSGLNASIISLALTEAYQGRVARVFMGVSNDLSEMTEMFVGYMDLMDIEESADTAAIRLSIENKLIDLDRPRVARYTSAYQKALFPGDKGLDFLEDLQDAQIYWGRAVENGSSSTDLSSFDSFTASR